MRKIVPNQRAATPKPSSDNQIDERRRKLITWLWRLPILATLLGGGYGIYRAYRVHFNKSRPVESPRFDRGPAVRVTNLENFTEPWSKHSFTFDNVPSIALRVTTPVPGGIQVEDGLYLIAFSRICTHQGCLVNLNRNLDAIAVAFNHRVYAPALTCACHLSIFDPGKAGQVLSGPAVLPLPRIRLELRGSEVWATGQEK
jgi:arsenite oxidase small subunit